jgi:valyl-tRNA synthetase
VYIHGLVRDEHGKKMSKSKGNTIVPAEVQERYGTDAVRFTMAILAAPGNDIPLAPERMEGYRAFANKLWNATRFALMKIGDEPPKPWRDEDLSLADRWILSRAEATLAQVTRSMERYRFDHAADALYHFVWHQFCDWYIELVKPAFQNGSSETAAAVLLEVLSRLLRLLHPFMPFVTEELWHKLPGSESYIAIAPWPVSQETWADPKVEAEMEMLQALVVRIRNVRSASNIDSSKRIRVLLHCDDPAERAFVESQIGLLCPLVRAEEMQVVEEFPEGLVAAKGVAGKVQIALPLEGLLDLDAERARLEREMEKLRKELDRRTKRLGNASFVEKAPADVVQKERRVREDLVEHVKRLETQIAALGKGS